MGALCTTALLLQVLLVALSLFLQQTESGRGGRPSQDVVRRRPLPQTITQYPWKTGPCRAQRLQAGALPFVVLSAEVQDGLQPLPLLGENADQSERDTR